MSDPRLAELRRDGVAVPEGWNISYFDRDRNSGDWVITLTSANGRPIAAQGRGRTIPTAIKRLKVSLVDAIKPADVAASERHEQAKSAVRAWPPYMKRAMTCNQCLAGQHRFCSDIRSGNMAKGCMCHTFYPKTAAQHPARG